MYQNEVSDLLEAPCIFCGYNGQGYFQAETHSPKCPWRLIGGLDERVEALPGIIVKMHKCLNDYSELVTLLRREVVEMDRKYPDGRE